MIRPLNIKEYGQRKEIVEVRDRMGDCFDDHEDGNRHIYVYELNGKVMGEGALRYDAGDADYTVQGERVYMSRVIVDYRYRNQGIGAKIVNHLVEIAKAQGFKEISIGVDEDNLPARHLYHKLGFTVIIFKGEDEGGKYLKLLKKIS